MANYFARKAGNINATDVWATTPSGTAAAQTFVAGDVLYANNFAITVNVDTNLGSTGEVRNDNTNSATAGGSFTLSNGVTLTANAFAGSTSTACVIFSGATGNSATLVGNATASNAAAAAASNTSTGTLSITGNCTGGSVTNAWGANNNSTGTMTITGNATAGSGSFAYGVVNSSTGTVTITGNVTGGSAATASWGAANNSTGTMTITGNVTGGNGGGAVGANNNSTGTITITGNCTGGSVSGANGAANVATGTMTIVGNAIASNTAIGVQNTSTGTVSVVRAVGNSYGIGAAGGVNSVAGLVSSVVGSDTRAEELEYGANGQAPTSGAVRIVNKTNNRCIVDLTTGVLKTLADPSDGTGQANQSDVRSGVSYALGNRTGTCAVPAASSVAFGVAVDATTGTAALTPAAVWNALTSGMTTSGSIGARLKNAATVDTTGQSLADALTPAP